MAKPKSAEDILTEMPSGDDLLASLAMEVGIDLNTPVEGAKKVEEDKPKATTVESPSSDEGGEPNPSVEGGTESKPKKPRKNSSPKKSTSDKTKTEPKPKKEKSTPKANKPVEPPAPAPEPPKKTEVTGFEKQAVFGEWRGFKVNYMGKPMFEEGKFITLPKRYDSKLQESFRATNGRMVMVVKKLNGKVIAVHVYAEDKDGKRDELTVGGVMVNPNRMENRCRVYAHLLGLAYDRKKDIEEVAV